MHPMINYWSIVFSDFQTHANGAVAFHNPSFPDPLMSPKFLTTDVGSFISQNPNNSYFNCISTPTHSSSDLKCDANKYGYECVKSFSLGTTNIQSISKINTGVIHTFKLESAHRKKDFSHLLKDGFPKDYPFLNRLMGFLPQSKAQYSTLFMEKEGSVVAMITTGICGNIGLVLNAVVHSSQRGQGLSHQLVNAAIQHMKTTGVETAYFWTELASITKHGHEVDSYMIFSRV